MDDRHYLNGVRLELSNICNRNCSFCYLKIRGENFPKELPKEKLFRIVDKLYNFGVLNILLTGGEPLVYKYLDNLLPYLRTKKFRVRLVTNGEVITNSFLKKNRRYIDYIHMSFHGYSNDCLKKIKMLERFKIVYNLNTILTKENIEHLDNFYKFIKKLDGITKWSLLRDLSVFKKNIKIGQREIVLLIEKLLEYRASFNKDIFIDNPFPFCAYVPEKVSQIVSYRCSIFNISLPDNFTIDYDGFVRPCSIINYRIAPFLNFKNNGLIKNHRRYQVFKQDLLSHLPDFCRNCVFFQKCNSGCRAISKILYNDYTHMDPLANPKKYL